MLRYQQNRHENLKQVKIIHFDISVRCIYIAINSFEEVSLILHVYIIYTVE